MRPVRFWIQIRSEDYWCCCYCCCCCCCSCGRWFRSMRMQRLRPIKKIYTLLLNKHKGRTIGTEHSIQYLIMSLLRKFKVAHSTIVWQSISYAWRWRTILLKVLQVEEPPWWRNEPKAQRYKPSALTNRLLCPSSEQQTCWHAKLASTK